MENTFQKISIHALVAFTCLFFLSACSIKNYEATETKIVTLKTKKFRFSDIAYLRHTDRAISLELYMAGRVVKEITINHLVCVSGEGCLSKERFNAEYLSDYYPDDLLQNIFLSQPIFDAKNLQRDSFGFTQHIKNSNVDITYKVRQKETSFKDRKNHILLKIKDTQ